MTLVNLIPISIVFIICTTYNITDVLAGRGCCSWHGGQDYCDTDVGRWVCNDGTYSPTCGCEREAPKVNCPKNSILGADNICYCNLGYKPTSNKTCELDPVENCKIKYPGTQYRLTDGMCACKNDEPGTSSWDTINKCVIKPIEVPIQKNKGNSNESSSSIFYWMAGIGFLAFFLRKNASK